MRYTVSVAASGSPREIADPRRETGHPGGTSFLARDASKRPAAKLWRRPQKPRDYSEVPAGQRHVGAGDRG
jgi:hypothetical protein